MSKSLIKTLLRIVQSSEEDYSAGAALKQFCTDYSLGQKRGSRLIFNDQDRQKIGLYLVNIHGIHPDTPSNAWETLDRHEAAQIGGNEKLTSTRVMEGRVAVKTLPGRTLHLSGTSLSLPPGANLDIHLADLGLDSQHDAILLIENWENFQKTHRTPLLANLPGNPLVVFRGDPNAYNPKNSLALIKRLGLPVDAFVDFDPEGLVIANALPHFRHMICPEALQLESALSRAKNQSRFSDQKREAIATLSNLKYPQLAELWALFDKHGQALPQEYLIGAA